MKGEEVAAQDSDQIDHRAGAGDRALDTGAVADVGRDELELADPAERLKEVGVPRLALGPSAPLARLVGDPRVGMAGAFLSLRRVLPDRYPLEQHVASYLAAEQRLGRLLDYAVIQPRIQRLYEWSAEEVGEPALVELVRNGNPIYAWPFEQRQVWRQPAMPWLGRVLERATRPR